jgi:hypothetical protein
VTLHIKTIRKRLLTSKLRIWGWTERARVNNLMLSRQATTLTGIRSSSPLMPPSKWGKAPSSPNREGLIIISQPKALHIEQLQIIQISRHTINKTQLQRNFLPIGRKIRSSANQTWSSPLKPRPRLSQSHCMSWSIGALLSGWRGSKSRRNKLKGISRMRR